MYPFVLAVGFNPYFDDITVTTLYLYISLKQSWHYPQFATSADPLSGFSISFTGFSGALFTLFNRTVSVAGSKKSSLPM